MKTYKKTAITSGILILLAYSLLGSDNYDYRLLGMFLEVISGLAVIGIAVLLFPLFKPYGEKASIWYLIFRGVEGTLMIIAGFLFLSHNSLLLGIRDEIYILHAYIFAVAALVFYHLLFLSNLIPRWMPVWGTVACLLLLLVNLLEVLGVVHQSVVLYLPIITNEIVIALWLIVKGFNVENKKLVQ